MTDKILIVEDDQDIANLMRVNLLELGVEIEHQTDGKIALECALSDEYAIVILDVMLPSMSGLDICRKVRDALPMQSIIMLTSKTSETDRVLGLELGADDYMTKPFSVRELQARVRSQLRKYHVVQQTQATQPQADTPLTLGRLTIDQRNHQVFLSDEELVLTATEFELLHHLASHPGQVFSRSQLLESVWGYHHSGYEHTVNSHINRLRSKLENDATAPQIVQTVWGVGYKFNPQGV
ncbi:MULTISPECIES: response regulator transcription factor [Alteromonas]|jgi:two-component system alkaline phosphatase synthesis response regulator PhoP|uniref:Two-component system response regulator n=1 Tax=Alteromonas stellipolaris TaxID=233316 RepID=A0ABM5YH07_9ALTE|nr:MULTISPECIES: response regulator transcription factor [Alteromonas]AMJ90003.1 two-component system response regulator [Alteromonas sp. Mac2]ALM90653.1 DNA-binding response regulator [Alteromonas stellipolaris LMG 21856]AMJ73716.1 two-component system response regulator [Alteromonas stellipolaris]AMJ86144.1 two-component system response regulator [Alteromonas sp. Mac1]AMJ93846.1 two-component system response regulator [Alteromonas stellipolaris]